MLHALISHHRKRATQPGVQMNGLHNCHVIGLTSIMLHDEPGNRIRLFITEPHHQLYREADTGNPRMALAIHPHHCDVHLIRVFGTVRNDTYRLSPRETGPFLECEYRSAILSGKGGLEPTGRRFDLREARRDYIESRYGVDMPAKRLHSIYVPKGSIACWLVIEGAEDPDYKPVCYTANPSFDSAGMYVPMTNGEIERTLTNIKTRVRDSIEGFS